MNMKYLPLAFILCAAPAVAEDYKVTNELGSEFIFHHETMQIEKKDRAAISHAIWTFLDKEKNSVRMRISVTGCGKTSGNVTTYYIASKKTVTEIWVSTGPTMYDHMAVVQCLATLGALKTL